MAENKNEPKKGINWTLLSAIAFFLIIFLVIYERVDAIMGENPKGRSVYLITQDTTKFDKSQREVAKLVETNYREFRSNAEWWSLVYNSFIFLSIIFSGFAGVILKSEYFVIDEKKKKDWASVLTVLAAILVAISANGDFQRKWESNRIAAANMEQLSYDLLKIPFTVEDQTKVIAQIKEICGKRNHEIVGDVKSETAAQSKTEKKKPAVK